MVIQPPDCQLCIVRGRIQQPPPAVSEEMVIPFPKAG